jgi:hypothetical protein
LAVAGLIICSCRNATEQRNGDLPRAIPSPDGQFLLVIDVNQSQADLGKYLCLQLVIQDSSRSPVYQEQTGASSTARWEVTWDDDNRVWLYSADIGTYYWEQRTDNTWVKFTYAKQENPPSPPDAITAAESGR